VEQILLGELFPKCFRSYFIFRFALGGISLCILSHDFFEYVDEFGSNLGLLEFHQIAHRQIEALFWNVVYGVPDVADKFPQELLMRLQTDLVGRDIPHS